MSRMWRLRAALLTIVGALVLHQGRYLLAPPEHLHAGAHTYFAWAVPLIAILAAVAVAELAVRLTRSRVEQAPRLPPGSILFLLFSFALLTIFGVQESLETVFSHGVLPQANPLIADGAWVSIPLALAGGAVLALLLRGVAYVVALVVRRAPRRLRGRRNLGRPISGVPAITFTGLCRSLAPRGPPPLPS